MEKDRIMLILGLIFYIFLFFYGAFAMYNPKTLNEWYNKSTIKSKSEKNLNIFEKIVLKKREQSRTDNFINLRITGVVCMIMAIISILLILRKIM